MENPKLETTSLPNRYFRNLSLGLFEHPEDHAALEALRRIPGLDRVLKSVSAAGFEPIQYTLNISNNIRVSPHQEGRIYGIFKHAVQALDIEEPELYITNDRALNAYTSGMNKPWVVVNSGLIESVSDIELLWIFAHELGHIMSGHMLYHTASRYLLNVAARVPVLGDLLGGIVSEALLLAMLRWQRKSELTADRVAHLVVGDLSVGISVLYKLSGGYATPEPGGLEAFLSQAEEFTDIDKTLSGKAALLFSGAVLASHPFTVVRAKALQEWDASDEYTSVCNTSMYSDVSLILNSKCPSCDAPARNGDLYCSRCGKRLAPPYLANSSRIAQTRGGTNQRSELPGALGKRVNGLLDSNEFIEFEIVANTGIGVVITNHRIFVVRAGRIATGDFRGVAEDIYDRTTNVAIYQDQNRFLLVLNHAPSNLELKAFAKLNANQLRELAPNVIPLLDAKTAKTLSNTFSVNITHL